MGMRDFARKLRWKMLRGRKKHRILRLVAFYNCCSGYCWGQSFEDIIAERLLGSGTKNGVYVDIGAHHPVRYSNTYRFFLKGWSGINIDPLPESKAMFDDFRPKDINLNIGISEQDGNVKYYCFEDPLYNTISSERAQYVASKKLSKIINTKNVRIRTLKSVFEEYLDRYDNRIDFLNIDVETLEYSVVKSNDWEKYRPLVIAMESLSSTEDLLLSYDDPAVKYLIDNDYKVVQKVNNTIFMIDKRKKDIISGDSGV